MGETKQIFENLEGKTVKYRATAERVKEATVIEQAPAGEFDDDVILNVKLNDPSDRLHGFTDEEVAAGEALRFSTHGNEPGQWTMDVAEQEAPPSDVEPASVSGLTSNPDEDHPKDPGAPAVVGVDLNAKIAHEGGINLNESAAEPPADSADPNSEPLV